MNINSLRKAIQSGALGMFVATSPALADSNRQPLSNIEREAPTDFHVDMSLPLVEFHLPYDLLRGKRVPPEIQITTPQISLNREIKWGPVKTEFGLRGSFAVRREFPGDSSAGMAFGIYQESVLPLNGKESGWRAKLETEAGLSHDIFRGGKASGLYTTAFLGIEKPFPVKIFRKDMTINFGIGPGLEKTPEDRVKIRPEVILEIKW